MSSLGCPGRERLQKCDHVVDFSVAPRGRIAFVACQVNRNVNVTKSGGGRSSNLLAPPVSAEGYHSLGSVSRRT